MAQVSGSLATYNKNGLSEGFTMNYSSNAIELERFYRRFDEKAPKYSQIDDLKFYIIVGQSLSSKGDLQMGFGNNNKEFTGTLFYDKDNVVKKEEATYTTDNISGWFHSKNSQSGRATVSDAVYFRFKLSATIVRTWKTYGVGVTFTATLPIYTISAVAGTGGTVTGGGTWDVTVDDQTKTLTATPNSGYKFSKWVDSDGNTYISASINVTISQNNISAFETTKTYTAFFEKMTYAVTVTAGTGGTVSGGGTYEHGSNITLKAVPSAGYKFVKWSDGVTTASRTITVTANASYTAVFSPICVLYDSIFNFYRWVERGITSSRGAISNINDLGFTFTASVDDGYTGYSHMFAVEPGKKYTLEYDCSGGASNQTFVFFHSASGDYSWTKLFDSASKKWSFTVPDGFYLASIRVDVNTKGETINYSNFRIYPADCDYMGNTLKAVDRFDSAKWSMPTPTRDCYIFQGWNTKADGSGKFYTEADAYPTEDLILYSIWKADPPKFVDAQILYNGKIVSSGNKIPAGQSFILKCKLE